LRQFRIIAITMLVFVLLMGLTLSVYGQDKAKETKKEQTALKEAKACCQDKTAEHVCKSETPCEKCAKEKAEHAHVKVMGEHGEKHDKAELPKGHPEMKEGEHTAGPAQVACCSGKEHKHAEGACKDKHAEGECKKHVEKEKK